MCMISTIVDGIMPRFVTINQNESKDEKKRKEETNKPTISERNRFI